MEFVMSDTYRNDEKRWSGIYSIKIQDGQIWLSSQPHTGPVAIYVGAAWEHNGQLYNTIYIVKEAD